MGCCGIKGDAKEEAEEEKRAKKTNKDIERQIQKDKQVGKYHLFYQKNWKNLDSGKRCWEEAPYEVTLAEHWELWSIPTYFSIQIAKKPTKHPLPGYQ